MAPKRLHLMRDQLIVQCLQGDAARLPLLHARFAIHIVPVEVALWLYRLLYKLLAQAAALFNVRPVAMTPAVHGSSCCCRLPVLVAGLPAGLACIMQLQLVRRLA